MASHAQANTDGGAPAAVSPEDMASLQRDSAQYRESSYYKESARGSDFKRDSQI